MAIHGASYMSFWVVRNNCNMLIHVHIKKKSISASSLKYGQDSHNDKFRETKSFSDCAYRVLGPLLYRSNAVTSLHPVAVQ